jgi:DNA-directed RNA polymerase subunit RPC12/RpoP
MDYAKLETAVLSDVDEGYYYGASCQKCEHRSRLDLVKLRSYLGEAFPLVQIRKRLRCERCGSREVTIVFLAPNQKTGSVAYLFGEMPRS